MALVCALRRRLGVTRGKFRVTCAQIHGRWPGRVDEIGYFRAFMVMGSAAGLPAPPAPSPHAPRATVPRPAGATPQANLVLADALDFYLSGVGRVLLVGPDHSPFRVLGNLRGCEVKSLALDAAHAAEGDAVEFRGIVDAVDSHGPLDALVLDSAIGLQTLRALLPKLGERMNGRTRLVTFGSSAVERAGPGRAGAKEVRESLAGAGFDVVLSRRLLPAERGGGVIGQWARRLVGLVSSPGWMVVARRVVSVPLESLFVSIVVPCKDERENVLPAVERLPKLAGRTEIIFCDDHSTDGTAARVREAQRSPSPHEIRLVTGPGICKSRNVWTGFDAARGDILIILDGDLAVRPEELPAFVEQLAAGRADFVNGTRLVHRMQAGAMPPANYLGNRAFAWLVSLIMGQKVTDTLCGTKALWARDWSKLRGRLGTWGADDRWGDFELLFGAARLQMRIAEVAVHYAARTYGESKMVNVWRTGGTFLRLCLGAWRRLRGQQWRDA